MTKITKSSDETEALGAYIAALLDKKTSFVALYGEMGAGKTAFVRGFASVISPGSRVKSPTYTVVNEYRRGKIPLFHFDLYRLDRAEQLEDTGLFDVLGADGVCVIEWGEQFANEIGDARVDVFVTRLDAEAAPGEEPPREVRFVAHDARGEELVDALTAAMA